MPTKRADEEQQPTRLSAEDTLKRMTVAVERCGRLMGSEDVRKAIPSAPLKVRARFVRAVLQLAEQTEFMYAEDVEDFLNGLA